MRYKITALDQLGLILKGFRKEQGLTQKAIAAQLDVSQQAYAQLEADPSAASLERLFRVLRVMRVDLELSGPLDIESRQQTSQNAAQKLGKSKPSNSLMQAGVTAKTVEKPGKTVKAARVLKVGTRSQREPTAPAAVVKKREAW